MVFDDQFGGHLHYEVPSTAAGDGMLLEMCGLRFPTPNVGY